MSQPNKNPFTNGATLFVEQGLKLLKPGGILGFVLPHKLFRAVYGL
jgi:hypothetical protein